LLEQIRGFFVERAHEVVVLVGQDCSQPQLSGYIVIDPDGAMTKKQKLKAMVAAVHNTNPDLVYSISGIDELDVLRFLKVPRVRHVFSLEQHEYLNMPLALSQMKNYLEGVTANTPDVLGYLNDLLGSSKNIAMAIAPYKFSREFFAAPNVQKAFRPYDVVDICFVGRLESFQKRANLLPDIMEGTCRKNANLRWHVYGDGPLKSTLENRTAVLRLKGLVKFHGWLNNEQLRDKLISHQLFFLCSRWEGLPVAMIEAMLLGLACVVPDIPGGIRWILNDGGGWIYSADSVDHAIKAILSAAGDADAIVKQQGAAQECARKIFDAKCVENQLIELEKSFEGLEFNGNMLTAVGQQKMRYVSPGVWWKRKISWLNKFF